jgi:hypothetical protein
MRLKWGGLGLRAKPSPTGNTFLFVYLLREARHLCKQLATPSELAPPRASDWRTSERLPGCGWGGRSPTYWIGLGGRSPSPGKMQSPKYEQAELGMLDMLAHPSIFQYMLAEASMGGHMLTPVTICQHIRRGDMLPHAGIQSRAPPQGSGYHQEPGCLERS